MSQADKEEGKMHVLAVLRVMCARGDAASEERGSEDQ